MAESGNETSEMDETINTCVLHFSGFNMVLESLYHNEIEIDLDIVPSLIASASMLSLVMVSRKIPCDFFEPFKICFG